MSRVLSTRDATHLASMSRLARLARRRFATDAKTIPTYGERAAFFVGATETSGRGAYAARDVRANDVVLSREAPLACHRTLANATTRCDRCLRETRGMVRSIARRRARRRRERARRVNARWTRELRLAALRGLKFPLLVARGEQDRVGVVETIHRGLVVFRQGCGARSAAAMDRGVRRASSRFGEDPKMSRDIITPEWYANVTTRLHLNSFRRGDSHRCRSIDDGFQDGHDRRSRRHRSRRRPGIGGFTNSLSSTIRASRTHRRDGNTATRP